MTTLATFLACSGTAPSTQLSYRWYLTNLQAWLVERGRTLEDVDPGLFMEWLDLHTWAPATRRFAVAAVRAYTRYTFGDAHPCLRLKMRTVDSGPQRTLSLEEAIKLLRYLTGKDELDCTDPKRVRDLALVSLLLDTGLRAFEASALTVKNLDLAHQQLGVMQKGSRWRTAIYSVETRVRLRLWLSLRDRIALPGVEEVFVGIGGKKPGTRITPSGLRVMFRAIAPKAGIPHFGPHALRRSMACISLVSGASTRLVQRQGGWSNSKLVETYSRMLPDMAFAQWLPTRQLASADARD